MIANTARHKLVFERDTPAPNAYGELVENWQVIATRRAALKPMRGNERYNAQRVHAEVDHKITVRYDSTLADLSPKDRIRKGARIFKIDAVINVAERNRELEILATEVV